MRIDDLPSPDTTEIHRWMYAGRKFSNKPLSSKEGIEMLFPDFIEGKEKIAILCAHDDDALAGSTYLINNLVSQWGAQIFPIILTNGKNGYSPEKVLASQKTLARSVFTQETLNDMKFGSEEFITNLKEKMEKDKGTRNRVVYAVSSEIIGVRKEEARKAYSLVGVPDSNIIYYNPIQYNTSEDNDLEQFLGMNVFGLPESQGIYRFLIKELRQIEATRFLTINGGDSHPDHKIASEKGVVYSLRSKSNMPHLGKPAPLKNNAEGTHGHFYLIYENLPEGEGEIYSGTKRTPKYKIFGTDDDVELKTQVLNSFVSQPRLVPVWNMMPDERFELFQPFPSLNYLMNPGNGYLDYYLDLAEANKKTEKSVMEKK